MSRRPRLSLSVPPTIPFHEPDLVPAHKEAIIQALRWAWSELAHRDPQVLRTGREESITERLQELLNEQRQGKRLASWLKDFESVTRSEHQRTADGRLQKMPDLSFRPPIYASVTVLLGYTGTRYHHPGPARDRSESEHERSRLSNPCIDVMLIHLWLAVP
jgi:hypothetical protein